MGGKLKESSVWKFLNKNKEIRVMLLMKSLKQDQK